MSEVLLKKLLAAGVGERPVVFITHRCDEQELINLLHFFHNWDINLIFTISCMRASLGGLVVKQMLQKIKNAQSF